MDSARWGVRCQKDLREGTFVCAYVGKIITDEEAVRTAHMDVQHLNFKMLVHVAMPGQLRLVLNRVTQVQFDGCYAVAWLTLLSQTYCIASYAGEGAK